MQNILDKSDYDRINSFITAKLGLNFPAERINDLTKALAMAAADFKIASIPEFIDFITTSRLSDNVLQVLSKYLTIGETYFFREKIIFDTLQNVIIPKILADQSIENKQIKIWSAGCSSGEEPYSVAMLIDELLPFKTGWDITIQATDINTDILSKAKKGVYGEWSFRDVNPAIKKMYFIKTEDNKYELIPRIKSMIRFDNHNLVEDLSPSPVYKTNEYDLILCRNVLMYFTEKKRGNVISSLFNSLKPGGYLILGLTEISYLTDKRFERVTNGKSIYFNKPNPDSVKNISTNIPTHKNRPRYNRTNTKHPPKNDTNTTYKSDHDNDSLFSAIKDFNDGRYSITTQKLIKFIANVSKDDSGRLIKTYYYLSLSFANMGEFDDALKWCDEGISNFKFEPILYFIKSNILQGMNDFENAVSALQRAIYLNPNYIMAHFSLANVYRKMNNRTDAYKQFKILSDILESYNEDEIVTDSGGLTVFRIKEIIRTILGQ